MDGSVSACVGSIHHGRPVGGRDWLTGAALRDSDGLWSVFTVTEQLETSGRGHKEVAETGLFPAVSLKRRSSPKP